MATETFNDDVIIDGTEDEVQLTVQGYDTQTEALQEWQDYNGNPLARITADGRFQSGDLPLTTPDALIEAHRDEPSSLPQRGIHSLGKIAGVITTAIAWMVGELELVGTAAISSIQTAVRGRLTHSSTGDSSNAELRAGDFESINQSGTSGTPVGTAVGVQATVDNQQNAYLTKASGIVAQIQNATGADIETAVALEVAPPVNNGTIDTLIGLDIPDINEGTDNYALRTGDGVVHVGDVMELAQLASDPANKADVVQFYGKGDKIFAKAPDPDNTVYDLTGGGSSASVMQGATSSVDGAEGLVPQPLAGDEGKYLKGDGTWDVVNPATALDDLSDVDTTGASNGDVLGFDGTDWSPVAPSGGGSDYAGFRADGRLTLESGDPFGSNQVLAATNLYYTPYLGDYVALFDGSDWQLHQFTELTLSLSGLSANTNYDIFLYDNSGSLTLEALAWTNDSTRATALAYQNGILVKSGATTRLYLGTIRTTATTGQCEDSSTKRFVWNMYNRVLQIMYDVSTTYHTYGTATWREWGGAGVSPRVDFVLGLRSPFDYTLTIEMKDNNAGAWTGLSINGGGAYSPAIRNLNGNYVRGSATNTIFTSEGFKYLTAAEYGASGYASTIAELRNRIEG